MDLQHTRLTAAAAVVGIALLAPGPSVAAIIQVAMTGGTDNTFVGSGDPCGTGLSGGNACNGQTIVINLAIDTAAAPADSDAAGNQAYYSTGTAPGFVTGSATINGHLFVMPSVFQFNFGQTIELFDNLDGGSFGTLDRVQFGIDGRNASETFAVGPNLLMTSGAFSGDTLDVLGTIAGSPLATSGSLQLSNGSFNFANASGQVQGQYRLSSVAFSVAAVPLPASIWLLGTAVLGVFGGRRIRRPAVVP